MSDYKQFAGFLKKLKLHTSLYRRDIKNKNNSEDEVLTHYAIVTPGIEPYDIAHHFANNDWGDVPRWMREDDAKLSGEFELVTSYEEIPEDHMWYIPDMVGKEWLDDYLNSADIDVGTYIEIKKCKAISYNDDGCLIEHYGEESELRF